MSRFYLTMNAGKSNSTTVTRRAHAGHGANTVCASYDGAIRCTPYVNDAGKDCVRVTRESWQGSGGATVVLYDGPFDVSNAYATDLK